MSKSKGLFKTHAPFGAGVTHPKYRVYDDSLAPFQALEDAACATPIYQHNELFLKTQEFFCYVKRIAVFSIVRYHFTFRKERLSRHTYHSS